MVLRRWAGLSAKQSRTSSGVHRKKHKALGMSDHGQAKALCFGTWMSPERLVFHFRLCIRSPKSSENAGHGRNSGPLNLALNEKDWGCWYAVMCIPSRAGVYLQREKHVLHVQLHWRAGTWLHQCRGGNREALPIERWAAETGFRVLDHVTFCVVLAHVLKKNIRKACGNCKDLCSTSSRFVVLLWKTYLNEGNAACFESWGGGLDREKENGKGNSSLPLWQWGRDRKIQGERTQKNGVAYIVTSLTCFLYSFVLTCLSVHITTTHRFGLNLAFQMAAYFGYSVAATDINGDK